MWRSRQDENDKDRNDQEGDAWGGGYLEEGCPGEDERVGDDPGGE